MANHEEKETALGFKAALLRHTNERRTLEGKAPLETYPEIGCTSCGEVPPKVDRLFQSAIECVRTCEKCVLGEYPLRMLRLPTGESIEWYRNSTGEHRTLDFCIALTGRALYTFSSFWLIFSRWRRIPLREVRDASFLDSRHFPALHVQLTNRVVKLRSPPSTASEMQYDRRCLIEAAERLRAISNGESRDA